MFAPADGSLFLCDHLWILHIPSGLGFEHVDGIFGLSHEVGLILVLIVAPLVEDLELSPARLEPLLGFPIENDRENSLRIGLELLSGIEALFEASKD